MNEAQRQEFLDQSRAHYEADMLLKGTYGTDKSGGFKGCSVGCHLHHIGSSGARTHNKHAIVAEYYGYPEWLAHLQDTIFEGLPGSDRNHWHVQLAETLYALPDDYNWQTAMHRVRVAILNTALRSAGNAAPVVQAVIDLHERAAQGESVTNREWEAELAAEWAAAREEWAAARAAEREDWAAAREAARAAARAAEWAAAREEWAAEWAAAGAAYQQIRDAVLAALSQQPGDAGEKSAIGNAELDAGTPNHFDSNKRGFDPK